MMEASVANVDSCGDLVGVGIRRRQSVHPDRRHVRGATSGWVVSGAVYADQIGYEHFG